MSSYLGRLLQATARSEQRLHPMAGSVYGERAAAIEPPLGPELAAPHWGAEDQLEGEQTSALPVANLQASMTMLQQRATPWPLPDLRRPGPAESSSVPALDSRGVTPPDPIREMTPISEQLGPVRTRHDRDDADFNARLTADRPPLRVSRSETYAASTDRMTDERSAAVVMGQGDTDELMARHATSPFAAELKVRQPAWQQKPGRADEAEVQVYIGRIEVLAVQPPAPAAAAPRRETATRLADYLAARNGSSR
jgi:hypothetical protein